MNAQNCGNRGILKIMGLSFELLERMLKPHEGGLSEELSRYILSLHFTDAEKQRYLELADKVDQGPMTPEEQQELENFVELNEFLTLIQSKARLSLRRQPAA